MHGSLDGGLGGGGEGTLWSKWSGVGVVQGSVVGEPGGGGPGGGGPEGGPDGGPCGGGTL